LAACLPQRYTALRTLPMPCGDIGIIDAGWDAGPPGSMISFLGGPPG